MQDNQDRRERRRLKVSHVAAILAVAIVVGCLLAGVPLKRSAENVESQTLRSVALAVAKPLAAASEGLRLEAARRSVITAFGGSADPAGSPDQEAVAPQEVTSTVPSTLAAPSLTDRVSTTVPPSSSTSTSEPAGGPGKVVTRDHPLRVLAAGDSLMIEVGHAVARLSERLPVDVTVMYKVSSGLTRTDFFDWPVELKKKVALVHPDVTVLMYGNNDKQSIYVGNRLLEKFTPDWWEMYRERIRAIIAIPEAVGSTIIWVGMPIMRGDAYSATARGFNKAFSQECEAQDIPFIDTYKMFADPQGHYAAYLPNVAGKTVLVRNTDGIHLTEAGGDLVAAQVKRLLERMYDFQ